ncbi:MAG: hypothetical protein J4F28_00795 [Nitrosopumilaceae archaeon]|nr:hypothetical protein [Nitrosopumilaceae archaeon]
MNNNNGGPFEPLLSDLEAHATARAHADRVRAVAKTRFEMRPSGFVEIRPDPSPPRRTAFVDGGNGILAEAPDYLIVINRVYYSVFRGAEKLRLCSCTEYDDRGGDGYDNGGNQGSGRDGDSPTRRRTATFLSCVLPHADDAAARGGMRDDDGSGSASHPEPLTFDTRIYPYGQEFLGCLPDNDALLSISDGKTTALDGSTPLASLARRLAEIRLATRIASDELGPGDILVMDGSLQTSLDVEKQYAGRLYDTAVKRGVIVCGLAKTTRLLTESGEPLLARASEIAAKAGHDRWYVPVAEGMFGDGLTSMLAAKLHPRSRFVFRIDVLCKQFRDMDDGQRNAVFWSLAANSGDVAALGYPYGLIDADKHAQVRKKEAAMYRRSLYSRMEGRPEQRRMLARHPDSIIFHDILNRVTG